MNRLFRRHAASAAVLSILAILVSCSAPIVDATSEPSDSHATYREALGALELDQTSMGREWINEADRALELPVHLQLPFEEVVYFDPASPAARGYAFSVERGRRIAISVETENNDLFADLYREPIVDASSAVPVASRNAPENAIVFEPRRDGDYVLRVQPQLLVGGMVTIRASIEAALAFPVQGGSPRDIGSFYGDPRDGGSRIHEGLDIFAPRGTPLLAASAGTVRVGRRNRGGNVVSIYDEERNLRLYYAHLEEQLVSNGQWVDEGDVIGTTGNTGNAVTTPPHLHIGVYAGGWSGSVDPWAYLVDPPRINASAPGRSDLVGEWVRVIEPVTLAVAPPIAELATQYTNRNPEVVRRASARAAAGSIAPSTDVNIAIQQDVALPVGTAVRVIGAVGTTLRVAVLREEDRSFATVGNTRIDRDIIRQVTGFIPEDSVRASRDTLVLSQSTYALDPGRLVRIGEIAAGAEVRRLGTAAGTDIVLLSSGLVVALQIPTA